MKKLTVFILFILFTGVLCISQDSIYILHPAIGEIIDRQEKNDFALFPEVTGSGFEYSYIKLEDGNFWLKSYLFPDSLVVRQLDTLEINRIARNMEAMISANPGLLKAGVNAQPGTAVKSVVVKTSEANEPGTNILSPEDVEKISSETNSNERLNEDAERSKLVKQGSSIDGDGLYIDFSHMKKKKHKK